MFKEYTLNGTTSERVGGGTSDDWTRLWKGLVLSTDRQVEGLARTPQWSEISRVARPGMSILEAGCGLGAWVRFFKSKGLKPVGLDYSAETIKRLTAEFPGLDWREGDIRRMDFADGSFDLLVSWGVIEHLEEGPARALAEFHRVIRPGGYAFITVPWLSPWRLRTGWSAEGDNLGRLGSSDAAFHQYYLTEGELSDLASRAGFELVRVRPSSIHAKSLLPMSLRKVFPRGTKVFNRLLSPVLPERLIASMILLVGRKRAG